MDAGIGPRNRDNREPEEKKKYKGAEFGSGDKKLKYGINKIKEQELKNQTKRQEKLAYGSVFNV